jgi:hypothetical protein
MEGIVKENIKLENFWATSKWMFANSAVMISINARCYCINFKMQVETCGSNSIYTLKYYTLCIFLNNMNKLEKDFLTSYILCL